MEKGRFYRSSLISAPIVPSIGATSAVTQASVFSIDRERHVPQAGFSQRRTGLLSARSRENCMYIADSRLGQRHDSETLGARMDGGLFVPRNSDEAPPRQQRATTCTAGLLYARTAEKGSSRKPARPIYAVSCMSIRPALQAAASSSEKV